MAPKELTHCNKKWTQAQYNSFVKSLLRKGSMRWPPKNEVLSKARLERGIYLCATGHQAPASIKIDGKRVNNIFVDHLIPIVEPSTGFNTWGDFINGLFCDSDNLQVLCKSCHDIKSKEERATATSRNKKKED